MELYSNIKKRREELGMTQDKLAELTGYGSRTSIAKIEAGKVDLPQSKIEVFAIALKTTPARLMGWDREEEKTPTFKWVARNIEEMNEEQLKKLQGLMKIAFDNLYKKD